LEGHSISKERYHEIRVQPNFIFLYYLEMGGRIPNETAFIKFLTLWLAKNFQVPFRSGARVIVKHLDAIYEFNKK